MRSVAALSSNLIYKAGKVSTADTVTMTVIVPSRCKYGTRTRYKLHDMNINCYNVPSAQSTSAGLPIVS